MFCGVQRWRADYSTASHVLQTSDHVFPASGYKLSVHVWVHELLKQDVHAQSCLPFSYWKLHSTTHLYCVGFVSPTSSPLEVSERLQSVSRTHQIPLQHLCKSSTWQTTPCWVLTSIRWSNHMWLTHQWSRINDYHLWLAPIFHWWLMSSYVITSDSPNHHSVNQRSTTHRQLLFIATHMLHKGACVCLVICLQLGNTSTKHTPDHFSVCEVMRIFPLSDSLLSLLWTSV